MDWPIVWSPRDDLTRVNIEYNFLLTCLDIYLNKKSTIFTVVTLPDILIRHVNVLIRKLSEIQLSGKIWCRPLHVLFTENESIRALRYVSAHELLHRWATFKPGDRRLWVKSRNYIIASVQVGKEWPSGQGHGGSNRNLNPKWGVHGLIQAQCRVLSPARLLISRELLWILIVSIAESSSGGGNVSHYILR